MKIETLPYRGAEKKRGRWQTAQFPATREIHSERGIVKRRILRATCANSPALERLFFFFFFFLPRERFIRRRFARTAGGMRERSRKSCLVEKFRSPNDNRFVGSPLESTRAEFDKWRGQVRRALENPTKMFVSRAPFLANQIFTFFNEQFRRKRKKKSIENSTSGIENGRWQFLENQCYASLDTRPLFARVQSTRIRRKIARSIARWTKRSPRSLAGINLERPINGTRSFLFSFFFF